MLEHNSPVIDSYLSDLQDYLLTEQEYLKEQLWAVDEKHHQVLRNTDLQEFRIKIEGEMPPQQELEIQSQRDYDLMKRIEEYNRVNRSQKKDREKSRRNRRKGDSEEKSKRKVRTTITVAKLEEMNRIFRDYLDNQERRDVGHNINTEMESLKSIGQKLGLGYSTILHKFREFRATKKVKGGALIAALNQKRKYKKSRQIEDLIEQALKESKFFTAVQLSKYIQDKFGKKLSRSIISRHLGQMGYACKTNTPSKVDRNSYAIKQVRSKYAKALTFLRQSEQHEMFYLDQCIMDSQHYFESQKYQGTLYLTILISLKGIQASKIHEFPLSHFDFRQFLNQATSSLATSNKKVIVLDMDPIHYGDYITSLRDHELVERNFKLFYLPPESNHMNLVNWFFQGIRSQLQSMQFKSPEEFSRGVEQLLEIQEESIIHQCYQKVLAYEMKAIEGQDFDFPQTE